MLLGWGQHGPARKNPNPLCASWVATRGFFMVSNQRVLFSLTLMQVLLKVFWYIWNVMSMKALFFPISLFGDSHECCC